MRSPSILGLIVFIALGLFGAVRGQELSILHSFSATDTAIPNSVPVRDAAGNSYGTSTPNSTNGQGTIYKMASDGTVTILHSFGAGTVPFGGNTTTDGAHPTGNLILASDGNLYGTTWDGGATYGTVYRISTAGTYSVIYIFAAQNSIANPAPQNSPGVYPESGVIQGQDGNLYGTASAGGDNGTGAVFRLSLDGSTYTVLHSFAATVNDSSLATNDAAYPWLGLVQDAQGNLYGATTRGGSADAGAVYEINHQSQYAVIYNFPARPTAFAFSLGSSYTPSGSGAYSPNSALVIGPDGNLYGTASGVTYGSGVIYKVTPQGAFTLIHQFGDGTVPGDGAEAMDLTGPNAGQTSFNPPVASPMILGSDGKFYGATPLGGAGKSGVIFQLTSAGQFAIIHAFGDGTLSNDGANPVGLVQGSDGNFYGTTSAGGTAGLGTVFTITTDLPLFTSPLQVAATAGNPFTYQMTATNGPVTFTATSLPAGFTFDGTNTLSTTSAVSGTYTITLTATNAAGSNTVPLVVTVQAPPVISSMLNLVAVTSASPAYVITATNAPTSFAATGLPPGVSVNPATGVLSGTPTAAGTYSVTISATNEVGTGTATLTLTVVSSAPTVAEEYTQIHNFGSSVVGEGSFPGPMIVGSDGTFYGVTAQGGPNGDGTVFNLLPSGVTRVIASFNGTNGSAPQAVIQTTDGTLYGTTQSGGSANLGTIFKITPGGTIAVIHSFGDHTVTNDGANPQAGLFLASNGNFYGTTQYGGSASSGTVFQMTPAGVVTTIHSFGDSSVTNDGAQPVAALVQGIGSDVSPPATTGIVLLGTTLLGGAQSEGTLFAITNSGAETILHSFDDPTVANDGWLPHASVLVSSGTLSVRQIYGTTMTGGSLGKGTIFAFGPSSTSNSLGVTQVGAGMSILHNFGDGTVTNDGENPISPLVMAEPPGSLSGGLFVSGNSFYGTTQNGGVAGQGTLFNLTVSGPANALVNTVSILHSFGDSTFTNDGTMALGGVCVGWDGNLYGSTVGGGSGSGTAYSFQLNLAGLTGTVLPANGWTCSGTIPEGMTFDSTTGALVGTPSSGAALGSYSLTITKYTSGVAQASQTVTLQLNQTFTAWANQHSVSAVVTSGSSSATPDGVPTVLKYLFDIAPNAPMSMADHAALPTLAVDDTLDLGTPYVALTYRQYAGMTGMGVTLESSSDMVNWAPVPTDTLISKQSGTDPNTGDPMMEMGTPMDNSHPQQFLRLQVTPP